MLVQNAVVASVEEVDAETYQQQDDEPPPVLGRQREHEQKAGQNAGNGHERHQRRSEWAFSIGIGTAHDEYRRADHDESEECTDVDQLGQQAKRQERAENGHKMPVRMVAFRAF